MPRLRVGIVDFLNSRPLAWGFLQGHHRELFEASYHPPSRVAELMAAGDLDVGLLPSIELQRIPGLEVVPGLCIAAQREVRSVLLVSRLPIGAVRRLALDVSSRTSIALIRVLLAERWGSDPELVSALPDLEAMLADCDAALLIGDPALHVDRSRFHVVDLAAEWRALTGLPFVFAVWAVAPGVALGGAAGALDASLRAGREAMEQMVREAAEELGLQPAEVRRYLEENLCFQLGEAETRALEEFFRRAHRHGLIGPPAPLRFCRPASAATP